MRTTKPQASVGLAGPSSSGSASDGRDVSTASGQIHQEETLSTRLLHNPNLAIAVVLIGAVVVNTAWIYRWRRGFPVTIDEAGYLQRSLRDGQALSSHGLVGLWQAFHGPDPQAPLLPLVAGVVQAMTGLGPTGLMVVEQLFYMVAVVSTYTLVRRLAGGWWGVLGGVVVAATPGLIQYSRAFYFALPATALLSATLAIQLWNEDFSRLTRALTWGFALGLMTLTRTMVLALMPALMFTAALRLVHGERQRYRALNLLAGLTVMMGTAGLWYSASWRQVLSYLTNYGYGSNAASYGPGHPVLSWGYWTIRFDELAQLDLLAPLTVALILCLVLGMLGGTARYSMARRRGDHWRWGGHRRIRGSAVTRRLLSLGQKDAITVLLCVILGYIALSTSRNLGSAFELPLVPAMVALAIVCAAQAQPWARPALALSCVVASGLAFADQAGLISRTTTTPISVTLGLFRLRAFDSRGLLLSYADGVIGCQGAVRCAPDNQIDDPRPLQAWSTQSEEMAHVLHSDAARNGRLPVVFFAVQDPFFNTNTLAMAAQLIYFQSWGIGVLRPPTSTGLSLTAQLEAPQLGQPNLVIEGRPPRSSAGRAFSPLPDDSSLPVKLRTDGFTHAGSIRLPDGRVMTAWWKNRGPTVASGS